MERTGILGEKLGRWVSGTIARVVDAVARDRDQLPAIAAGFCVFVGSLLFAPLYLDGDQWVYHRAYQVVEGLDLFPAYYRYERAISGGEYLHFLIVWIASTLAMEKNLVMALANSMLAAYSVVLIRRYGGSLYIAIFLVLTNFYWYVLYFSAERLKFAFLFMILSLLSLNNAVLFAFFSALALLSHHSLIFVYSGIWLVMAAQFIRRTELSHLDKIIPLGAGAVLIMMVLLAGNFHIGAKLTTYLARHEAGSLAALGPVFVLVGLSCLYSKRLVEPVLLYLPILIGIVFLGGSRLNMLAYFIFLYHCLKVGSGFNVGVVATSIYLAYKSIGYVASVIEHGHGFQ